MIIRSIVIENFQSYYQSQTLEFSEGLNLIVGNGGKGKSKLFNAFYWVLFGKIYITGIGWCKTDELPFSAKLSMKKHEYLNKKALSETSVGDIVTALVRIDIENDEGIRYQIERSAGATRRDGLDWDSENSWNVTNSFIKVSYDTPTGTVTRDKYMAEDTISKLFPEGIRDYIWFQGESLENLINFRKKETLKAAVKHISYFPYYEKLSEIITKSKERIERQESTARRAANKHNQNVKVLQSTIDGLRSNIKQEELKQEKLNEEIGIIQVNLANDENKMSGLASFTELVSKYKTCENEIARLNEQIFALDKYQRKQLPELWLLRGATSMLEVCRDLIKNHKEEENTLPEKKYLDNPSRSKLEEIIKDKRCFVCGSIVEEGTETYHYIIERMRLQDEYLKELEDYTNNLQLNKQFNMYIGKIQDYPDSLSHSVAAIDKQYSKSEEDMTDLLAKRKKKLDEKRKLDELIEEAKKKCGVDPVRQAETAGMITSTIRVSRGSLERKQNALSACKTTLRNLKVQLSNAEKEYENLVNKDKTIVSVPETEWKNISIFLEDICKRVQENARKELLRKIEERANEFYKKFTEHDRGYKGEVKIGDDYSIEFDAGLNTSHEDRKKMSIINALLSLNQEAMGIYYPFISDAPTSSFDLATTYKYLVGIKDIFGQTIIMTKDADLNDEKYIKLLQQEKVGKIYQLESNLFCGDETSPDVHEVTTKIIQIK